MVATASLGYRNIDLSKKVLGVLLVAEVGIVLALDAAVFVNGGGPEGMSRGFTAPEALLSGAPGLALLFCFLSFLGFEATAVFRDECRDPNRTIPIATYLAVTLVGVFYVVSTWALISAWGDQEAVRIAAADPVAMLPGAVAHYLGGTAEHVVQVLFVTSLFACLLSIQNVSSRYVFNISNRGALPAVLGTRHERHGSPSTASHVVTVIAAVFVLVAIVTRLDPATELYGWFAGATTVGFIVMLLGTTLSALVFFGRRWRSGALDESFGRVIVVPLVALVCLVAVFVLVLQNLRDLVGGSRPVAWAVLGSLALAFAWGFTVATRRPELSLDD
jgi:amino acid transporter